VSGNLNARRRFFVLRNLLDFVGIEPERLQVTWCSAAEGDKWATVVDEVSRVVERLGPLTLYKSMMAPLLGKAREIDLGGK
jgi:F420-non-reducing hydrogenase iron-sulfur subunit